MTEKFQQKANKLMSKLNIIQGSNSILQSRKTQYLSSNVPRQSSSQMLIDLHKFQQEVQITADQNKQKVKGLNDQMHKLEKYLQQQNQARNNISENFMLTATKVQKNMNLTLSNIKKSFQQKQRKFSLKIESLLNAQKKQISQKLNQNQALLEQISMFSSQLAMLSQQLQQMKKSRYALQQKIYKQFSQQLKELRKIYQRNMKQRDEMEQQLVESLKGVFDTLIGEIKQEEHERELNQKGFLEVIEQVINRIVQY